MGVDTDHVVHLLCKHPAGAYARVDHTLVSETAPEIAFATESEHDFFSARIGYQLYQRMIGMDLGALCIRKPGS
jgi:hypothetical protein